MIGQSISRYDVVEKLGEGGMGVVFKARDRELGRLVALKILPAELIANEERRLRFLQEARAASSLNHPHIVTIYEISSTAGTHYIAMEFVRGRTLDRIISEGGLTLRDSVRHGIQISDALAAAHSAGTIHRDLKPANLMISEEGVLKVLDFGLAKLAPADPFAADSAATRSIHVGTSPLTQPGILLGTVAYMSPEQAEGREIDGRSDMFSFGTVLYEMVSGRRAFEGPSSLSILTAVLRDEPRSLGGDVPAGLQNIVSRCLQKDRNRRFASMGDVKLALEEVYIDITSQTRRQALSAPFGTDPTPTVAVLPFANLSADKENEYFSDGLAEEIINALTHVKDLRVTSRTSSFSFRGKEEDVRLIGEKLKVGVILEGSVRRSGNRVRVTAQLVNVADGFHLWSERYDRDMDDIFAIQDEIAHAIVEKLKGEIVHMHSRPLVRRHTTNLEAYDLYLKGTYFAHQYTAENLTRARECFERAIAVDPRYALAQFGLSYFYGAMGWFGFMAQREIADRTKELARRALELDPDLPEAHMQMGNCLAIYDLDWEGAEREFQEATRLDPSSSALAESHAVHLLIPNGRLDEAIAVFRPALERDPFSVQLHNSMAWTYFMRREFTPQEESCRRALEIQPNYYLGYQGLGLSYFFSGDIPRAIEAWERACSLAPGVAMCRATLAMAFAALGRSSDAKKILDELLAQSRERYVSSTSLALIQQALGNFDEAFRFLDRAIDNRDGFVFSIKVSPLHDPLRGDPRFASLLKKLRLQQG